MPGSTAGKPGARGCDTCLGFRGMVRDPSGCLRQPRQFPWKSDGVVSRRSHHLLRVPKGSFFLFGVRGVGKRPGQGTISRMLT